MTPSTEQLIKASLRSIATSLPGMSSLVQAWSEYESHQQSRRVEEFFEYFQERLRDLGDQTQALNDYVKTSGELPILMERVVLKVQREVSQSKRERFARVLTRCLTAVSVVTYEDKLDIIETLDTLTERDIEILHLFTPGKPRGVSTMWSQLVRPFDQNATEQHMGNLVVSLSKLEARGLIAETTARGAGGVISMTHEPGHWTSRWQGKSFELLAFGVKFIEAIRL